MKTTLLILLSLSLLPLAISAQEPAAPAPEAAAPAPQAAVPAPDAAAPAPPPAAPSPEAPAPAATPTIPAPEAALAPKIACDASVFDFGEKNNTEVVEHDYPIRNAGTLSLEIRNVHASCGCTAAKPSQTVIPPGGDASIHVRLDLRGRNGTQVKSITVASNDPDTPNLVLQLKGTAIQALRAEPPTLFIGRLEPGAARNRTFDIVSARGPIQIKNLRADHPGIQLRPVELETAGDGTRHRFELTLAPDLPEGAINGSAFILTDMAGQAEVSVPVAAFIVNPPPAPVVEAAPAVEPAPTPAAEAAPVAEPASPPAEEAASVVEPSSSPVVESAPAYAPPPVPTP